MPDTYQFTWEEANHIRAAIDTAKNIPEGINYCHLETNHFDLDIDRIGLRVSIPHSSILDEERKPI